MALDGFLPSLLAGREGGPDVLILSLNLFHQVLNLLQAGFLLLQGLGKGSLHLVELLLEGRISVVGLLKLLGEEMGGVGGELLLEGRDLLGGGFLLLQEGRDLLGGGLLQLQEGGLQMRVLAQQPFHLLD